MLTKNTCPTHKVKVAGKEMNEGKREKMQKRKEKRKVGRKESRN